MTERKEEVKDYNNLSTKQKLQKARIMLQKRNLNKTGFNKFANFKYFQLSDFFGLDVPKYGTSKGGKIWHRSWQDSWIFRK